MQLLSKAVCYNCTTIAARQLCNHVSHHTVATSLIMVVPAVELDCLRQIAVTWDPVEPGAVAVGGGLAGVCHLPGVGEL